MNLYVNLILVVLVTVAGMLLMLTAIRKIPAGHRGVLFRLGRLVKELPAGTAWVLPFVDSVMLVNLSEQIITLPADLELTGGDKHYQVEGYVTCKIIEPIPAVLAAMQAQQDLAVVIGKHLLTELRQMGAAAVVERPAQAEKWTLEALNAQLSLAWQITFTKVELRLNLL